MLQLQIKTLSLFVPRMTTSYVASNIRSSFSLWQAKVIFKIKYYTINIDKKILIILNISREHKNAFFITT